MTVPKPPSDLPQPRAQARFDAIQKAFERGASLVITVSSMLDKFPTEGLSPRDAFWSAIRRSPDWDVEEIERHLERTFGPALKREMPGLAGRGPSSRMEAAPISPELLTGLIKAQIASELVIVTEVAGYSSMILGVTFGTLGKLATLFDHNFDLFALFLTAYVPIAFRDALYPAINQPSSAVGHVANLSFGFQYSPALMQAFAAAPSAPVGTPEGGQNPELAKKTFLIWAIANFSLLIPLGVAIWLFADARSGTQKELDRSAATETAQRTRYDTFMADERKRLLELERLLLERWTSGSPTDTARKPR